ncbi:hypothetical protein FN846DRAFT_996951 [Sphaerosporella brunnea]|uniref:Uncharacterized protein n=1 Tax=Sphaerosporella brunnea TaxID=1250544 RepID=A0A5J5F619_9PEZI|nr:hypothetical protein FN846DRAFT_996951 [Sphaerosporella brunnea]
MLARHPSTRGNDETEREPSRLPRDRRDISRAHHSHETETLRENSRLMCNTAPKDSRPPASGLGTRETAQTNPVTSCASTCRGNCSHRISHPPAGLFDCQSRLQQQTELQQGANVAASLPVVDSIALFAHSSAGPSVATKRRNDDVAETERRGPSKRCKVEGLTNDATVDPAPTPGTGGGFCNADDLLAPVKLEPRGDSAHIHDHEDVFARMTQAFATDSIGGATAYITSLSALGKFDLKHQSRPPIRALYQVRRIIDVEEQA